MAAKNKQLVLALFASEALARQAAEDLKQWDKANEDVKAGAVGVLVADEKGHIKEHLLGPRAGKKGAGIGMVLGLIAAVPTGGLSLLGGLLGGAVGGGFIGTLFHKHLGMGKEESERIAREITGGKAAVGVLAEADEAAAFAGKLAELGGQPEHYELTPEGEATAAAALAVERPPSTAAAPEQQIPPTGADTAAPATKSETTTANLRSQGSKEMAPRLDRQARTILPVPDQVQHGLTTYDAKDTDTRFPPIRQIEPPEGAPNVLVVLLDDAGFGSSSAFGGPCDTPNFERLAVGGLRYNRFHTTALCAPTRAALLTGRNHHSVNMGCITELATSAPGQTSVRPNNKQPLAETLKLNGYNTAQFGKCHEVPVFHNSPIGPFDTWPTGSGFEYFYGFIGGEDNQWYPSLYEGTTPVEPPMTPEQGYHLTEDLADHAISWIQTQKSLAPEKPFFVYFAPGATHAPHHVAPEWIEKYKGKFAHGWDQQREITFARQLEIGVVPQDAELTPRPAEIPAWDDMPAMLKPVLERQMETYAAFMEHTDYNVGRIVDTIEQLGIMDNTLIYVIVGDNGASAEGTPNGTFNEFITLNGMAGAIETPEFLAAHIDKWGSPQAYNHYAVGWAWAMDTPYQWTKQVASHWGGTRNGTIVHWPKGIEEKGGLRTQFTHVIDVAPTVLEAAGIPEPIQMHGITQSPYEGTSMLYSFNAKDEPERHDVQYFEMFCNRGIYYKGWSAVTRHSTPWTMSAKLPAFDDDTWELYDGSSDWTQARDLAQENPEMLRKLQRAFLIEATKYNVLPLDDRRVERFIPALSGRPTLVKGNKQIYFPGMKRISEATVLDVKNKSFQVTAQIVVPEGEAQGTLVALGGSYGGWGLMIEKCAARFVYNLFGVQTFVIDAKKTLTAGEHQVRAEFAYAGGGPAKGGDITFYYDGEEAGGGKIPVTQPVCFSATEGLDIGRELGTPVLPTAKAEDTIFNGKIKWVELSAGNDDHSHMIEPDDYMRMIMSKQ